MNSNNKVPDAVVKAVVDFWRDASPNIWGKDFVDEDDVRADIEVYFGGVVPPKDAPIWDDEQYFIDLFTVVKQIAIRLTPKEAIRETLTKKM